MIQVIKRIQGFKSKMISVKWQKKLTQRSRLTQLLAVSSLIAGVWVFAAPILSGSNHRCPVLREKDIASGPSAQAVPAFARKYNVDCTYCHTAWPQLNRTGYIFRRLGYRLPNEVPTSGQGNSQMPSPAVRTQLNNGVTSASQIADGQKVFQAMQCFTCHTNGENLIDPSKPIKGQNFLKKYSEDAQIASIIRSGRAGTAMPAYDKQRLNDDQLSSLIAYIRSLTPAAK
jgi:cytochrome c5